MQSLNLVMHVVWDIVHQVQALYFLPWLSLPDAKINRKGNALCIPLTSFKHFTSKTLFLPWRKTVLNTIMRFHLLRQRWQRLPR